MSPCENCKLSSIVPAMVNITPQLLKMNLLLKSMYSLDFFQMGHLKSSEEDEKACFTVVEHESHEHYRFIEVH